MYQNRNMKLGEADRIRYCTLVAEVRERHKNAVDLFPVRAKKRGAFLGIRIAFNSSELCCVGRQRESLDSYLFEHIENFLASGLAQMGREEASVPDDHAQGG